ncbi:MAG: hypothetical protein ACM3N0_01005 [Chloroflexota bacterium]
MESEDGLGTSRAAPGAAWQADAVTARLGESNERFLDEREFALVSGSAERGFGVLHADRHFDLLASVLSFESVRID